jgi:peptidoglycan/LPS O-acetylase OafA/YrhL
MPDRPIHLAFSAAVTPASAPTPHPRSGTVPIGTAVATLTADAAAPRPGPVAPAAVLPGGEVAAPSGPTRLPSLTGLRWLAAFMVWGFHLKSVMPSSNDSLTVFFETVSKGGIGVSFFFVLSGFVLVWSYRQGDTSRAFLQRRFAKIYPNHAFALICTLLVLAATGAAIGGWSVLGNALLINSWFIQDGFPNALNPVAWTLCCEAFFYVTLPFLLPRLRRRSTEQLYVWLSVVPLVALLVNTVASNALPAFAAAHLGFFPPTRYHEFFVGVLVGELVVRGRWAGPGLWQSSALLVVTYVAHSWVDVSVVVPVVFAALIAAATTADLTGQRSLWRWRPLVLLGEASYAFYLVHYLVMTTVVVVLERLDGQHRFWFGEQPLLGGAGLFVAGTMVISLLMAFAMYRWLERPMMRVLGPRRRPHASKQVVPG